MPAPASAWQVLAQVAEHDPPRWRPWATRGRDQRLAPALRGLAGSADDRAGPLAEQGRGGQVGRVTAGPERKPSGRGWPRTGGRPLGEQQVCLLGPEQPGHLGQDVGRHLLQHQRGREGLADLVTGAGTESRSCICRSAER